MSAKKFFLDTYMRFVLWKSRKHAEEFRQMQEESHRTEARVMRYDIYSEDVRFKDNGQEVFTYVFSVKDGILERVEDGTKVNIVVRTDVPVVQGIATGVFTKVYQDGRKEPMHDFTVYDAWRIGRLEWEGAGNGLKEINLFHSTVFPRLQKELRLGG